MSARRLAFVAPLLMAFAGPSGAAAAAETPIQPLAGATPVRAWAGTAVLSVLNPATGRYRLATQRGTSPARPLPGIASAAQPFDADIGPGPGGRAAVIVFARCVARNRCHLSRTTLAGGTEIAIRGAAATDGWESAPTVWGSQLAFARRYGSGSQRIYTRPLTAGRDVRSVRMPGVPTRQCDEVTGCRTITDAVVRELDLRNSTLAVNVHFSLATVGICGQGQMRLVNLRRRSSQLVVKTICGLSGSTLLGASLTTEHLLFARICPGDPGGCGNHDTIIYRYGLADRRTAQATERDLLTGFAALSDTDAIEVRAPMTPDGSCTNALPDTSPPCQLTRVAPLAFGPAS